MSFTELWPLSDLSEMREQIARNEKTLVELEAKKKTIEENRSKLAEERRVASEETRTLQMRKDQLVNDYVNDKQAKLEQVEKDEHALAELEDRLANLEADLQTKIQQNAKIEPDTMVLVAELDKLILGVEDDIELETHELEKVKNHEVLVAKLEQAATNLSRAHSDHQTTTNLLQARQREISSTQASINTIQSAIGDATKRAEKIDSEASTRNATILNLQNQLQNKQSELADLESSLNDVSRPTNEELREQYEACKADLFKLQCAYKALEATRTDLSSEMSRFELDSSDEKNTYEEQLHQIRSRLQREAELHSELQLDIEERDRSIQEEESECRAICRKAKVLRFGSWYLRKTWEMEAKASEMEAKVSKKEAEPRKRRRGN